jgi:pimeloyl-ACP methyl ester carboxylesterase
MSTTDFRMTPPDANGAASIAILVAVLESLRVRGRAIEIRWWPGERSDTPFVLLHAGLGSVRSWRDFPEMLATVTGRRVFAYSRLGHGSSDLPAAPHTCSFMHEEAQEWLPAILDAAAIERAVLVGHSDGASISLMFAAAYPRRVEALVLEAPHVFVEDVSIRSIERMKTRYESGELRDRLKKHHRDADAAFHGWNDVWLAPEFRNWNLEQYLPVINGPALIIQGDQDEYGTLRQVDAIASQLGGPVETLILPGGGHTPHREHPDKVIDTIESFLTHAPRRRSTAE